MTLTNESLLKKFDRMVELQKSMDQEEAHIEADEILCDVLSELGYTNLVNEYCKIAKWYA